MPNEIYHWGIKGQRWGFRRFQNEDGSLTPEGELRYNQGKQKLARGKAAEMYKTKKYKAKLALKQEKQKVKDAAALAKTAKKEQAKLNAEDRVIKKKAKNMTDEELRNEVNRLAMELEYQKKSWQVERGKKGPTMLDKADSFFETTTGRLVGQLGSNIIQNVAQTQLNNIISEKTNTFKKIQIANAKKTGEKIQSEIDRNKQDAANAQKAFDAEYKKTYGDTESSNKNAGAGTKSAEDYVKDAFSGTKSGGAKGKKGQTWGKRDNNQSGSTNKKDQKSESTNKKEKTFTGNPFTPGGNKESASGSTEKKGFMFDPVDPISSEYVYDQSINVVKNIALPKGNSTILLPANTDTTLKKLGLK